jgi:hypothetical protein
MGVDRSDYIVFGWKRPSDNARFWADEEKYLPMIEGHQGEEFSLILDGMSGEYTVFGIILNSGGDKYEGWDFVQLDFKNLNAEKLKSKYREVFESEPETEPTLFIFSHFS